MSSPPICENINLVHHQRHVDRFQQMADPKQISQEDETRLTED